MKTLKTVTLTIMAVSILLAVGCTLGQKRHFGAAIDPKAPKVTLAELIAKPDAYAGKMVVIDGTHGGACADGDDFYFKDKFDIIEAVPPTPEVMQLKTGARVRLYGLVKVRSSGSDEAAEKNEADEKKEAGDVDVRIIAKGVDVL